MTEILEILKYTIPALVVFASVYFVLNSFLNKQYQLELLKVQQTQGKEVWNLKLQAYERLMVFCERISIDNLAFRLMASDMNVPEMRNTMLIAIQQEYEHNISQQIYTGPSLWNIIQLAKDQTQNAISNADGEDIPSLLINIKQNMVAFNNEPIQLAKLAIKDEVKLLI